MQRQAHTYLRHLGPWTELGGFRPSLPEIAAHRAALEGLRERALRELEPFDPQRRRRARAELGLRLALIGKGGAGKTVLCATLARQLARRGRTVLAVDLDTNPGLAISLGLGVDSEHGLPPEALEEHEGANYGWQLASGVSPLDAERYSETGPDGVRLLSVGKIATVEKSAAKRSVSAVLQMLLGFGAPGWDVLADLEAGPTTPFERYHAFADSVVVVVGPGSSSALTARRLLPLVGERDTVVVANGVRGDADHVGLAPRARIPFDPCVMDAERHGRAALDACPTSPFVSAVEQLAGMLSAE